MNDDKDNLFEQRLRNLLAKTGDVEVPPLTPERLAALRSLIPASPASKHSLSLVWRRAIGEIKDTLVILKTAGMTIGSAPAPLVRDGETGSRIDMISCPLPNGELKAQVVPVGNRKAKLILSVKGEYLKRNDLSVELSLGQRLLEARPLEQKAEVTLDGIGSFTVTLFAGDAVVGEMNLDIGEAKDPDNG